MKSSRRPVLDFCDIVGRVIESEVPDMASQDNERRAEMITKPTIAHVFL
jgi:hypothetical protein